MPRRGDLVLSRGQVLMYLHVARFNRTRAASLAGVSRSAYFFHMRRYKIRAPKPQAKLSAGDVSLIKSLLDDGISRPAVAKKFGVHVRTVEKIASYETWCTN